MRVGVRLPGMISFGRGKPNATQFDCVSGLSCASIWLGFPSSSEPFTSRMIHGPRASWTIASAAFLMPAICFSTSSTARFWFDSLRILRNWMMATTMLATVMNIETRPKMMVSSFDKTCGSGMVDEEARSLSDGM